MAVLALKISDHIAHLGDVEVDAGANVDEAKAAIAAALGVAADVQRLFHSGEELHWGSDLGGKASAIAAEPQLGRSRALELQLMRRTPEQTGWLREIAGLYRWQVTAWLGGLPEAAREDPEICLAAVAQRGTALQYAAQKLRAQRDFMQAALALDASTIRWAAEDLQHDRQLVLDAVAHHWCAFKYASDEFRGDKEVVFAALAQDARALEFVSEELRGDPEMQKAAAQGRGAFQARAAKLEA